MTSGASKARYRPAFDDRANVPVMGQHHHIPPRAEQHRVRKRRRNLSKQLLAVSTHVLLMWSP